MIDRVPLGGRTPGQICAALRDHRAADGAERVGPVAVWESSSTIDRSAGSLRHRQGRWFTIAPWQSKSIVLQNERVLVIDHSGEQPEILSSFGCWPDVDDPLTVLEEELAARSERLSETAREIYTAKIVGLDGALPPTGGLLGFVGYDTSRYFDRFPRALPSPLTPDLHFVSTGTILLGDRQEDVLYIVSPTGIVRSDHHSRRVGLLRQLLRAPAPRRYRCDPLPPPYEQLKEDEFLEMVEKAKEYIRAGDIFQVVLANRFTVLATVDPCAVYDSLLDGNPSPYHFMFDFPGGTYIGASPEAMLRGGSDRSGAGGPSTVAMRLVAGTYPSGPTPLSSREYASELTTDDKERAEHLMLVDHARNDIGRVAAIGSVIADDLFQVESYADVHHLVSQVSGTLRPGESVLSALRACFPIATLTGTPKIRAMEIIQELETPARGIFGGAACLIGDDGSIDSTVAIRAATCLPQRTIIDAGAGIVYDSSPPREYQECRLKARAVLRALGDCYSLLPDRQQRFAVDPALAELLLRDSRAPLQRELAFE